MPFNQYELAEIFEHAKDLFERFQSEQAKDVVKQAMENVKEVAKDVQQMYGLAEDAAEKLVATLLIVGTVLNPTEHLSQSNDADEGGAAGRGVNLMCEVTQLDELALMLRRDVS